MDFFVHYLIVLGLVFIQKHQELAEQRYLQNYQYARNASKFNFWTLHSMVKDLEK